METLNRAIYSETGGSGNNNKQQQEQQEQVLRHGEEEKRQTEHNNTQILDVKIEDKSNTNNTMLTSQVIQQWTALTNSNNHHKTHSKFNVRRWFKRQNMGAVGVVLSLPTSDL